MGSQSMRLGIPHHAIIFSIMSFLFLIRFYSSNIATNLFIVVSKSYNVHPASPVHPSHQHHRWWCLPFSSYHPALLALGQANSFSLNPHFLFASVIWSIVNGGVPRCFSPFSDVLLSRAISSIYHCLLNPLGVLLQANSHSAGPRQYGMLRIESGCLHLKQKSYPLFHISNPCQCKRCLLIFITFLIFHSEILLMIL